MRAITYGKWVRLAAAASVVGAILAPASPSSAAGFQFTSGDLVVERVGDGTATLTSSGNTIFLDEYTTAGALVGSVAMPTTSTAGANQQMLESGTAKFDGQMTLSGDSHYLVVSGYDTTAGGSSLTSSSVPRVAATVDSNANIDSTTALPDFLQGANYRSAASPDGKTLYLSGDAVTSPAKGGLGEAADGDATTTNEVDAYPASAGSGEVVVYAGALYAVSRTAGTGFTVATFTPSLPTGLATAVPLAGFPTAPNTAVKSPDSIFMAKLNPAGTANPDTIYVTDDSLGQIQKWSLSAGGTWSETGFITTPASAADIAVKGVTGTVTGSGVTLYVTANGSNANLATLYTATDNSGFGGTASGVATTLVNLPSTANETFRGVQFAPTPLPTTQVPEVPWAILLPLSAGLLLCGGWVLRRRATRA